MSAFSIQAWGIPDPIIPDVFAWNDSADAVEPVKQPAQIPSVPQYGIHQGNTETVLSNFLSDQSGSQYSTPGFYVPSFDERFLKEPIRLQPDYSALEMINFLISLPKEGTLVPVHATQRRKEFSFGGRPNEIEVGSVVNLAKFDPQANQVTGEPDSLLVKDVLVLGRYDSRQSRGRSAASNVDLMSLSDEQIKTIQEKVDPSAVATPYALQIELANAAEQAESKN